MLLKTKMLRMILFLLFILTACTESSVIASTTYGDNPTTKEQLISILTFYENQIQNAKSGKVTETIDFWMDGQKTKKTEMYEFNIELGRWNHLIEEEDGFQWSMTSSFDEAYETREFLGKSPFHQIVISKEKPSNSWFEKSTQINDAASFPDSTQFIFLRKNIIQTITPLKDIKIDAFLSLISLLKGSLSLEGGEPTLWITYEFDKDTFDIKTTTELRHDAQIVLTHIIQYQGLDRFSPMDQISYIKLSENTINSSLFEFKVNQSISIESEYLGQFFRASLIQGKLYQVTLSTAFESLNIYKSDYAQSDFEIVSISQASSITFQIPMTGVYYFYILVLQPSYQIIIN